MLFISIIQMIVTLSTVGGNIVNTAQGILRGVSSEDGSYISYNGIPYAGNPSNHRFRTAPPAQAWQGIREADQERVTCVTNVGRMVTGEEDCLFLNIHVPVAEVPRGSLRSIIVWLHGGGFLSGAASSQVYDPRQFIRRGIIMVAVNYRLGPLGFLCLSSEKAPGNAGVKDALLALRWVRDNIIAFGGDPAKVTLAGQSSGAAITEALVLSPTSNGLINRAILQSGSTLNAWAYTYDAEARAQALAEFFTDSADIDEKGEGLVNANVKDLVMKARELNWPYFPFALCTEKEFRKEERLLGSPPIEILTAKRFQKVTMMIGYNSNEAYVLAPTLVRAKASSRAQRDLSIIVPEELRFVSESEQQQVTERIRKSYFLGGNITTMSLIDYYTEAYFSSHIVRTAKLHAAASDLPVYLYEFSHGSNLGVPEVDGVKKVGPAHCDELAYLFAGDEHLDEHEREVQERLASLWANFVNHGNPTPETSPLLPATWEPLKGKDLKLYSISRDLKMMTPQNEKRLRMWEDIYDKYYYKRVNNV